MGLLGKDKRICLEQELLVLTQVMALAAPILVK